MAENVFKISESVALAKSIAKRHGISVKNTDEDVLPHARGGQIILPQATLYNHEQYMEHLHTAIGQVCPDNSFFDRVSPETGNEEQDKRVQTHLDIIRDMHCDKYMHGDFEGRDRQLASGYRRRHDKIEEHLPLVASQDPTAAALLYAGNTCRNMWQGYNQLECPPEAKEVLDKMPELEQKWMSLETEEDLKDLLQYIQQQEQQDGSQGDQQDESDGSDEGQSGEGGDDSPRDGETGNGSQSGAGDPSDSDGSDGGQAGGSDSGQGGDSEGGSGEAGGDGQGQGDQPSSGAGEQAGDSTEGGSESPNSSSSDDSADAGQATQAPPPGFGDAGGSVRDLGLIGSPPDGSVPRTESAPYQPSRRYDVKDARKKKEYDGRKFQHIMDELEGFKLSRKVLKYLMVLSQTRYEYGLKQGRLAATKIGKMYSHTGHGQPRMYKKKTAAQLKTDIAFSLVVDQSGSMRGDKFRVAAACAVGMSEVLQAINVPHEIITFTTGGGGSIINTIVKSFDERFVRRETLVQRFTRKDAYMGANADGESIQWAVERLVQRPESEKVTVVCSDGEPAYGYAHGDDEQYLKDVVKSIEDTPGMDILGIGIMHPSVKKYYTRHRVLRDLASLETVFMDLIKEKMIR